MKRLIILCLMLCTAIGGNAQDEWARTDSLMSSIYRSGHPGAAIAVIKGGSVVFRKGYGFADLVSKAPIAPSTNVSVCSMTEQFTAFAILHQNHRADEALGGDCPRFLRLP